MFPTGIVGAALFVLRLAVAASLLDGTAGWALVTWFWVTPVFLLPAICLCIGFLTPYCSVINIVIQLSVLLAFPMRSNFHLLLGIAIGGVLAILGPGAYSVDARLFGRRLVRVPLRKL